MYSLTASRGRGHDERRSWRPRPGRTRPRWRSGRCSDVAPREHAEDGMPVSASARRSIVSCFVVATRLTMTPAIVTPGRQFAKPATSGAIDWLCRSASTTRITGRPSAAARSPVEPRAVGGAVEEAHHALDQQQVGIDRLAQRAEPRRRHRPRVEVDRSAAGDAREDRGVDVVGAGLRRRDVDAAGAQRGDEAERDERLARARARRGDDEAASQGDFPRASRRARRGARAARRPGRGRRSPGSGSRRRCSPAVPRVASIVYWLRQRRVADHGQRVVAAAAGGDQLLRDRGEVLCRHVHDDHRSSGGDGGPVDRGRDAAGLVVAGEEDHRVVGVAVGDRDAGIGEAADARGDPRARCGTECRARRAPSPPRRRGRTSSGRRP